MTDPNERERDGGRQSLPSWKWQVNQEQWHRWCKIQTNGKDTVGPNRYPYVCYFIPRSVRYKAQRNSLLCWRRIGRIEIPMIWPGTRKMGIKEEHMVWQLSLSGLILRAAFKDDEWISRISGEEMRAYIRSIGQYDLQLSSQDFVFLSFNVTTPMDWRTEIDTESIW